METIWIVTCPDNSAAAFEDADLIRDATVGWGDWIEVAPDLMFCQILPGHTTARANRVGLTMKLL